MTVKMQYSDCVWLCAIKNKDKKGHFKNVAFFNNQNHPRHSLSNENILTLENTFLKYKKAEFAGELRNLI